MGAEDYIAKPFNAVFLRARIEASLERKRLRDREQETYRALLESQKRLALELTEAAGYVRSLLPTPLDGPMRVRWCYQPSSQLGGDAFGYHWVDEDHFAIYLLDVCGHGVGAALLSVSAIHVLRSQTLPGTDFMEPGAVLSSLNRTFRMEEQNYLYFTIWYGIYDRRSGVLRYATGGHPPAVALTEDSSSGWRAAALRTEGPAIGCFEGAVFGSGVYQAARGCTLYVVSDGVYEIAGADGRSWTFEGLVDRLRETRARDAGPEEHLRFVQEWRRGEGLEDDFSMVEIAFGG
jgi:sigma-B regulation protein RsbU (phosphoserine phosphatase)